MKETTCHSLCRWTFHAGLGRFVPANVRPSWSGSKLNTLDVVRFIKKEIVPRLPEHIALGFELHYDGEVNEKNAAEVADALVDAKIPLAMITPGAHSHFAYGGICSLDPNERSAAADFGCRTIELAYGTLRKAWHQDPGLAPTLVLWNGSWGYDLATVAVRTMYSNLKESIANLCRFEQQKGGLLYIGIEPKPNEGHPAMLLPTVASALLFWRRLEEEFGIPRAKKGLNKEFGHTEMIGLDAVYDTVEEIDNNALVHAHLNSQGYNDGITLGGPGKYDIDHGVKITGVNIALATLFQQAGYRRWKGHDMQVRPYDNERQGIDRVLRSIFSWQACEQAAAGFNTSELLKQLTARESGKAEDLIRHAVMQAHKSFDEMMK